MVVPVCLAACGGGSKAPGVASLGTTPATTALTPTNAASQAGPTGARGPANGGLTLEQYVTCMHAHGVPTFPNPIVTATSIRLRVPSTLASSPHFASAQSACRKLLPALAGGGAATITPADHADYVKAAQCMRAHGFPTFPDATISGSQVHFQVPASINASSTQFANAVATCRKLIPPGLPYSDA